MQRAELQAAAQSAQIGFAESDLYPRFTLLGSIGLRTSTNNSNSGCCIGGDNAGLRDFFSIDSIEILAGPSFVWNIFNYGRLKNNVRVQDARLQQLIVNYQETVLSAAQEVEDNLVGFVGSQNQAALLADAVKASQRSVELSLIQYRDGAVDYQRVIDSQRGLLAQQDDLAVTQGNVVTGLVGVYRALGGGWQLREGRPLLPEQTVDQLQQRTDWGELLPAAPVPEEPLELPTRAGDQRLFQKVDW